MITLGDLKATFLHIVSTQPPEHVRPEEICNDAGKALYAMHPWQWRNRPSQPLDYIAPIDIADATYTESTKTITKTAGFTDYTYRGAEQFELTAGTSATTGPYVVATRTSANAITLSASIGSAADGSTDIDGSISFPYCVLPSDFGHGEILAVTIGGSLYQACPSSLAQIRGFRENDFSTGEVYYAPSYPTQLTAAVAPANPLLELYPTPTAASKGALTLSYRSGWVTLDDDDDVANIPAGYEYVLRELCIGYAHRAFSGNSAYISEVRAMPELLDLKRQDGGTHPFLGRIEGGAARRYGRTQPWPMTVTQPGA